MWSQGLALLIPSQLGSGNLMAAISAECRDAKNPNQMKGGTGHLSPFGHEVAPNIFGHWRRWARMLHRIFQKHGKP